MQLWAPYYRVSHKDIERGISIEVQASICEQFARSQGWALTAPYVDDGASAYRDTLRNRPAFQRLLHDAQRRQFAGVLFYRYDRLARKQRLFLQHYEDLEKWGLGVRSATESADWLNVRMLALIAEHSSKQLSDRMKDVRRWEAEQGRTVGPSPVGYTRTAGVMTIEAIGAAAYKEAVRLGLTGAYGAGAIAEELNATGFLQPSGKPFTKDGVFDMLRNPVYAGYVRINGELHEGKHPPLIDRDAWHQLQEVNIGRSVRRPRAPKAAEPLLAGLVKCACCGSNMWHKGHDPNRYYRCAAHVYKVPPPCPDIVCSGDYAYARDIEEVTLALLTGLSLTPGLLDEAERVIATQQPPPRPDAAAIEQRLKKLARAYADDGITETEYERRRAVLLGQLVAPVPAAAVDSATTLALLRDLPTLITHATTLERRAVLRELITEVYARRRHVLAWRPTSIAEPLFQAAEQQRDEWLKQVTSGPGGHLFPARTRPLRVPTLLSAA